MDFSTKQFLLNLSALLVSGVIAFVLIVIFPQLIAWAEVAPFFMPVSILAVIYIGFILLFAKLDIPK